MNAFEKNIPQIIRDSLKPTYNKRDKDREADEKIPDLYSEDGERVRTRKGTWTVSTRRSYSVPNFIDSKGHKTSDGFCAVYRRENV